MLLQNFLGDKTQERMVYHASVSSGVTGEIDVNRDAVNGQEQLTHILHTMVFPAKHSGKVSPVADTGQHAGAGAEPKSGDIRLHPC